MDGKGTVSRNNSGNTINRLQCKAQEGKNTITYTLILDTAAVPIKHVTVSCTTEGYTEQLGPKGNTKEDVWFEPLQRHRLYRNFQWFSSVS